MTNEEVLALARHEGALVRNGDFCFDPSDLIDFAQAVRSQTLLEAADLAKEWAADDVEMWLRRMAGVE